MARRSGVTAPLGFLAGGLHCGVKKDNALDLALIVSGRPATVWGVFTTNRVKGAPVILSRGRLRSRFVRGVVANSGNSNTLAEQGLDNARRMASAAAGAIGCAPEKILVASTGVIGQRLPIIKIERGVKTLASSLKVTGGAAAAEAIMTTDLVKKERSKTLSIGSKKVTVGGCAKGSGMIHPNMATMLAFVTTDAAVSKTALKHLTRRVNDMSFRNVTVDGDTSTSDMFLVLANGASGAPAIEKPSGRRYRALLDAVAEVCVDLAKMIAKDGEGATKFMTVTVSGAVTEKAARAIAMSVAKSSLVKTAMFGEDANWGRIMCAAGYAGQPLDMSNATLKICGVTVFKKGRAADGSRECAVAPRLKKKNVTIALDLGAGRATAEVWTCDLSYDYVRINADYRT